MKRLRHAGGELLVVEPRDVMPRLVEGTVWEFGRRLRVGIDQVIPGGNGGGDDLVYFGPLTARGQLRATVRCGAVEFFAIAKKYGGLATDERFDASDAG